MARAVMVSQSTWLRIESGDSGLSVEQLMLAATHLHVKPEVVIERASNLHRHVVHLGIHVEPCRSWLKREALLLLSPAQLERLAADCES